jgi:hypothetical protein
MNRLYTGLWMPALFAMLAMLPGLALAQAENPPAPPPTEAIDEVAIGGEQGSTGAVGVNAAAGSNNQQANAAVVAVGDTSLATGLIVQNMEESDSLRRSSKKASIAEGAFAGSTGIIAVNVTAGSNNQQANLATIAIGIEGQAATDALLSQTRASQQPVGELAESDAPEAATAIGAGAFENSSGLVQVSLIGGERNTSANTFTLTVEASGNP